MELRSQQKRHLDEEMKSSDEDTSSEKSSIRLHTSSDEDFDPAAKRRAGKRASAARHKDTTAERYKKFTKQHPEAEQIRGHRFAQEHGEARKESAHRYEQKHREARQLCTRQFKKEHPEASKKRDAKYRKNHSEKIKKEKEANPEKVRAQNRSYQRQYQQRIKDSFIHPRNPKGFKFPEPIIIDPHYLGAMNNICKYCGAKHFSGWHSCCDEGKVWLDPLKPLPEPLDGFGKRPGRSAFFERILSLNTLFSFASSESVNIESDPHGPQVAKIRGDINSYLSCASGKAFGGYYVYDEAEQHKRRMGGFFHNLNEKIVFDLQKMLNREHAFAQVYKQLHFEMLQEHRQPADVRVMIVDPMKIDKDKLLSHPKVYQSCDYKQFFAIFYSASIEQEVHLPSLKVYPTLGKGSKPLPHWNKFIDTLCFPLLFPYGESGWEWKKYQYVPKEKRISYEQRLQSYTQDQREKLGYIYEEEEEHEDIKLRDEDTEMEVVEEEQEEESEQDRINANYNRHIRHITDHIEDDREEEHVIGTELRGGDYYPVRRAKTEAQIRDGVESDVESEADLYMNDDSCTDEEDFDENLMKTGLAKVNKEQEQDEQHNKDNINEEEETIMTQETSIAMELERLDADEDEDEEPGPLNRIPKRFVTEEAVEDEIISKEIHGTYSIKRTNVTLRDWARLHHQERLHVKNRFPVARKLGQLFTINIGIRIAKARNDAIRKHCTKKMETTRWKFLQRFQEKYKKTIGYITQVPATVPRSPRWLQKRYEETVAMANKYGRPHLFITFTTSKNWLEIKENKAHGTVWPDNSSLVGEVFEKKLEAFLNDVLGEKIGKSHYRKPGMFGLIKWFSYSIEYQRRGLAHCHLIVSLAEDITTAEQVNKICQATIPPNPLREDYNNEKDFEEQSRFCMLVKNLMVHTPCDKNKQAYCRKNAKPHWKTCSKHFPHQFSEVTRLGDLGYPELRRPDDGVKVNLERNREKPPLYADNRWVVPYNTQLLTKYEAHINVEVIASIRVLKYIYKYIFKGADRVLVEAITDINQRTDMELKGRVVVPKSLNISKATIAHRNREAEEKLKELDIPLFDETGEPTLVYDETHIINDMREMTAIEAAREIHGWGHYGLSHTVETLFVHTEDEDPIRYEIEKEEEQDRLAKRILSGSYYTHLTGWFAANQSDAEDYQKAKESTLDEMPKHFIFKDRKWVPRKNDYSPHILGRLKSVHPRNRERFAIRLLAMNRRDIKSFEELRTVDGVVHQTFVDAAKALNLMNNQKEWDDALTDAASEEMPKLVRNLYASILLWSCPENPVELWNKHKTEMYENVAHWTDDEKEQHALFKIQRFLAANKAKMNEFGLEEYDSDGLPYDYVDAYRNRDRKEAQTKKNYEKFYNMITQVPEQLKAYENILKAVDKTVNFDESSKLFFIQGSGGTGKTTLFHALFYGLQMKKINAMCVAATGIAASQLPKGSQTVHRAFNVPIDLPAEAHCKISVEKAEADELKEIDVVIWDEATMSDSRIFAAVDELFKLLHPQVNQPFAGVTIILGGDWKQTLPVVEGIRDSEVLNYTVLKSSYWDLMEKIHLKTNQRAAQDPQFAEFLLRVGDGSGNIDKTLREADQEILLPQDMLVSSEKELVDFVYGDGKQMMLEDKAAVISVANATILEVDENILSSVEGDRNQYASTDEHQLDRGFYALDPEVYHNVTPSGWPPHLLNLKVGAKVMLLRNLNVKKSLCNGTQMVVEKLHKNYIKCKLLDGTTTLIHRIYFSQQKVPTRELCFVRWQFPLRLSYAITVNKSQSQTLSKVGILLRSPCFSHGQLYVALSRAKNAASIKIFVSGPVPNQTSNVVFREALYWL